MPSPSNRAFVACAGSGKTTTLVEYALTQTSKRILLMTYTHENRDQIVQCFIEKCGAVPPNVCIGLWMSFLLQDCVRPYQNHLLDAPRIGTIFYGKKSNAYHSKEAYVTKEFDIYVNKLSEFAYECNQKSKGLVIKRLELMYEEICIDEVQDFSGYDLEVLEDLLRSSIRITVVGDPRQAVLSTNLAQKNRQYSGKNIYKWLKEKEKGNLLVVDDKNECFRCNQLICDFADALYPDLPKTISRNADETGHDGIKMITRSNVAEYIQQYKPVALRYNKSSATGGIAAINIGVSKGRTYNRVLIFPTKTMLSYLATKDLSTKVDITKLYVAVTRARHSVAFVVPDTSPLVPSANRCKITGKTS